MHRKERFIQKIPRANMGCLPTSASATAIESAAATKTAPIARSTATESTSAAAAATKATHE